MESVNSICDNDSLAPVMPAIDAVQQLMDEENRSKLARIKLTRCKNQTDQLVSKSSAGSTSSHPTAESRIENNFGREEIPKAFKLGESTSRASLKKGDDRTKRRSSLVEARDEEEEEEDDESLFVLRNNPIRNLIPITQSRPEEYEFIPKSVILDVYSNDPEVKRFLKQLPKIGCEIGYNEQDYKCYSCRRPVGLVFGQSRLCHFDGHHYCLECHLSEKSIIPSRILCNWDFNKYSISKRNQHFLTLISNEPMFEIKTLAPLLYKTCPELREIEELRCQAFFIRSYCFTCVQESISFELTKLVWPREHLIKQIDLYSLEDLIQIKSGALKHVLRNVITFGRQHVLSCMLCCQKGFICELCKSSQIIYPFDTETVYRCNGCQSIYHKTCFKSKSSCDECPRCQRLKARRHEN